MTNHAARLHLLRLTAAFVAFGITLWVPSVRAGQTPPPGQVPPAGQALPPLQAPAPKAPAADRLVIVAGRSKVLETNFTVERIAITDPEVADVLVVQPRELLINGKKPGTISLWIWGEGHRIEYELVVDPAVTELQQRFQTLFPGEDIQVSVSEGAILLSGRVSSNDVMLRAGEIAQASSPEQKVVNLLQLPGGNTSQQVMLQVRFAEVNSKAVRELGVNLFANRSSFAARSTTGQFTAPNISDAQGGGSGLAFSDLLNLFFFQKTLGIGAVIKALEQTGGFESLAEPNLIAYNGQEASFLAGGEFPVVTTSGLGTVNVEYREFGVRLKFKPTIAGDVIRLHVRPEVSTLDFNNGVTLSGFRIPALTTRYAETEVELRDGQSFAIAGLLNHVNQNNGSGVPFLSQIPIIGYLFKSQAKTDERTELLVLITPKLVRALNPDEVPPLPTLVKPPAGRGGGGGGGVGDLLLGGGGLLDAPAKGRGSR
jgi:pilus assembly protein CpaC